MALSRNVNDYLDSIAAITFAKISEMSAERPSKLLSILKMNCPACRTGHMYKNKSIFPLKELMDMPEECPVCGQKMEIETGFYFGTGYVSYGLSVALFGFNLVWYWLIFGISFKDNSPFKYLATSIALVLLLQPWLMRISRVIYLYMFVKYNNKKKMHKIF